MRGVVVVMAVVGIGCGSGNLRDPDAAGPCADRDGDGVCDEVDVCPDAVDPFQQDLDGDGLGTACDPAESVGIHGRAHWLQDVAGHVGGTYGVRLCSQLMCLGSLDQELLSIDGPAARRTQSAPGTPDDPWAAGVYLSGPIVTSQRRLVWGAHTTFGDLDVATGTFTPRGEGVILDWFDPIIANGEVAAFLTNANAEPVLQEPRPDGTIATVAIEPPLYRAQTVTALPGTPATFVIESERNLGGGVRRRALATYVAGSGTTELVTASGAPAIDLSAVSPVIDRGELRGYVVSVDGASSLIERTSTGWISTAVPAAWGWLHRLGTSWVGVGTSGAYVLVDGAAQALLEDTLTNPTVWLDDATRQLAIVTVRSSGDLYRVWAVTPTSATEIAGELRDARISISGATAHVIGRRSGPTRTELYRYRIGEGVTHVTRAAFDSQTPEVLTTAQGAAVILGDPAEVAPSGSLTLVPVALGAGIGRVLDGRTLIVSKSSAAPTAHPALYTYEEDAVGAPQLVRLTGDVDGLYFKFLERSFGANHPPLHTPWFTYNDGGGVGCRVARFKPGTGPAELETYPCKDSRNVQLEGHTVDGHLVLADRFTNDEQVIILRPGGAVHASARTPDFVRGDRFPTILGWTARDEAGAFACLASAPERCWSIPPPGPGRVARRLLGDTEGRFLLAWVDHQSNPVSLHLVRTIGAGDRN